MVSLQLEIEDEIPKTERKPKDCIQKLPKALLVLVIFGSGFVFALVTLHVASCRGSELLEEHQYLPICERGKLWKPEDAVVYTPHLFLPTYDIIMAERHLKATYKISQTIILDCPADKRTNSNHHPSIALMQIYANLLETSNNTKRNILPRFWLRTKSSDTEKCTELVQYVMQHTRSLFEGVLIDAEHVSRNVKIFDHWNKFDIYIGAIVNPNTCVQLSIDCPSKVLRNLHKVFFLDYGSGVSFLGRTVYVNVSRELRSCRNSLFTPFPIEFSLMDEFDSLNEIAHASTEILCTSYV